LATIILLRKEDDMSNTFTNLLYHLVLSTKNRKDLIQPGFREELYRYLSGIIRGEKGK
jgi:REP element-mobilizing transposase RayT